MVKVIKGLNDLATLYPDLIKEWDYNENTLSPNEISRGSNYKAFWICNKCGYKWSARVYSRTHGIGCPKCGQKKAKNSSIETILKNKGSLADNYPELLEEWDYDSNDINPNQVTARNNKKAFWICSKCNGKWEATIASRVDGHGCPYCSRNKVLSGKNDIKTLYPEVAEEWDYEKNGEQVPEETAPNSMKKYYWICSICGYKWMASANNRTHKHSGCPECAKNYHASFPEKAIFYYLSALFSDVVENANLKCLENKELDIFIPSINTAIEYDGEAWHKNPDRDIEKDNLCSNNGIKLIRIREPDCPTLTNYTSYIIQLKTEKRTELNLAIKKVLNYLVPDNTIVVDTTKDSIKIYELMKVPKIYNSIESSSPDIAAEWHPTKNGLLKPKDLKNGSNKKAWWKCKKCGYEWKTQISNRTIHGTNCPCCTGRVVVKGINDLATINPAIASEWNYEKNKGLTNNSGVDISTPDKVTSKSSQKVWWKCNNCGFEWLSKIGNRTTGNSKCPNCHKK